MAGDSQVRQRSTLRYSDRLRLSPTGWALLAITVLAAMLRLETLASQCFWRDEGLTVWEARKSLGAMLSTIPTTEGHPPLYPLLVWTFTHLFGSGEFAVRSLSALAGIATVPVTYAIGTTLASRRAGLIAAALLATSPFHLYYSQEARPYALMVLFGAISFLAFAHLLRSPAHRWLVLWAVASALALVTHYFAVFLIAPEALWLLRVRGLRRPSLIAVGAVGATGLALVPLLLSQRKEADDFWLTALGGGLQVRGTLQQLVLGPALNLSIVTGIAGLLVLATLAGYRRATTAERRVGLMCGVMIAVIFAIPVALKLAGQGDYLLSRYEATAVIPLVILLAVPLSRSSPRRAPFFIAGALCVFMVVVGALDEASTRTRREDWRGAASTLGTARAQRALVVAPSMTYSHITIPPPLNFYAPNTAPLGPDGATVSEIDVVRLKVSAGDQAQLPALPPAFHQTTQRATDTYVVTRYVAARPTRYDPPPPPRESQATVQLQTAAQ